MQRSPNEGALYFRESIARYLQRSRGIHVDVSQIIVGAGSEYLYSLIVQMLGRERVYALEDPSYEKIRRVYEANGAHCELLKLGRHGIHSSELRRSDAGVLHVTPFDSYPSGVTATAGKRQEYISWAKQPATRPISARFIFGLESPFAIDTEKASIASPTPSSTLFTAKEIPITTFSIITSARQRDAGRAARVA